MTWFLCLLLQLIWKGRCDDDDRSFTVNDGEVENERGSFTGMMGRKRLFEKLDVENSDVENDAVGRIRSVPVMSSIRDTHSSDFR